MNHHETIEQRRKRILGEIEAWKRDKPEGWQKKVARCCRALYNLDHAFDCHERVSDERAGRHQVTMKEPLHDDYGDESEP